jgi:hypothetical protein
VFKRFQHVKKMTNLGFDHLGNPVCQEIDPVRMRQVSAMRSENTLRDLRHLNLYGQAKTCSMAGTCHAAILHYWIDRMV